MSLWQRVLALGLVVACFPLAALGQPVPDNELPGRQAERFVDTPAVAVGAPQASVTLPSTIAPAGVDSIGLLISSVTVVGATVYEPERLAALYTDLVGVPVTLAAVYDIAARITSFYGSNGYVLSRAIVPPQELDPAAASITIEVVEGYVDRVEWPESMSRYRDFFTAYSEQITTERPVNIRTIERVVLLAGDLPGLHFTSSLRASEIEPRASTLVVSVEENRFDVAARLDNRGTEPRGPLEFFASATANNLLGLHGALTLSVGGAFPLVELTTLGLSWRQVLGSHGAAFFATVSYSFGSPGTEPLIALEYATRSLSVALGLDVPLIRSRDWNLALAPSVFVTNNYGEMLGAPSSDDRLRGFRLTVEASHSGARSSTALSATLSHGVIGLGSTTNDNPLASREAGRVDFTKIEGTLTHTQELPAGFSFVVSATGQFAFTPLLASEECGYGGRDFGRAFDPGELSGDRCWAAITELRYDIPVEGERLQLFQLYAFLDHGAAFRIEPAAGTPEWVAGNSLGVGLRLATDHFNADFLATKPLSGRDDLGWRLFFNIGATF